MLELNAHAQLYRRQVITQEPEGLLSGDLVHSGTVAECVTKVMAELEPHRAFYSMTVELTYRFAPNLKDEVVFLDYEAIQNLYNRSDFSQ
jgi:hypothetical protein